MAVDDSLGCSWGLTEHGKKVLQKKCQDFLIHVPRKKCMGPNKFVGTRDLVYMKKKIQKVCVQDINKTYKESTK